MNASAASPGCETKQGQGTTLAVDLDGTLIASDMLHETFWASISQNWRAMFAAPVALIKGRAALKSKLQDLGQVSVDALPYNQAVIEYIKTWRESGNPAVLVTASDQRIADQIAAHVGVFDAVYGSDGNINLKGINKAKFLEQKYGANGFAYVGDSNADLAVWDKANKAITVNASGALRDKVNHLDCEVEHLTTGGVSRRAYLRAMRPHQWVKNVLVFLPMIAAHSFTTHTMVNSLFAFMSFCLIASSVYVVNDLLDLKADREHPRKRNRPFASGAIPVSHGIWMAGGLLFAGGMLAALTNLAFAGIIVIYFGLTTAYSVALKRKLIVDVCTLAGLYTIRIIAGGAATEIGLSVWLLAFSIFLFFSLAAVKRQAELVDSAKRGTLKTSGRDYQVDDLPVMTQMAVASGYLSVLVLALYLNSPGVVALYAWPVALWGICPILLYWISRVIMITHRGHMHDDPIVFAARDRVSRICFLLVAVLVIGGAAL
ncbi:4-hydroxybenzoate polyprenyltransferase [Ruegeria halocynthiae]|uniref:4-hydroxybenzoate polyprenyltransferase n=1 Tax=Ruegeria halocynthiae TaxID=985054 RepID=A0A1H2Y629_9RHOB|nr:UbiA family prenyltransferase [Ruegeria halocynthiae]SDX00029.1 4-hydroxybenzoate polyprenyltransferase [Ruegeria halocynthiae]